MVIALIDATERSTSPELEALGVAHAALLPWVGQTLLQRTVFQLHLVQDVRKVFVAGDEIFLSLPKFGAKVMLSDSWQIPGHIFALQQEWPSADILVISPLLPFLLPHHVETFLCAARLSGEGQVDGFVRASNLATTYPMLPAATCEDASRAPTCTLIRGEGAGSGNVPILPELGLAVLSPEIYEQAQTILRTGRASHASELS